MSESPIEPADGFPGFVASRRLALGLNAEVFQRLVRRAESRERVGAVDEAVAWAQAAATFASRNHVGLFASAPLERLLARIGRRAGKSFPLESRGTRPGGGGRRRVLHIVTRTYTVGGHTRLLERWMRLDTASVHSLAVTQQNSAELSKEVVAACESSGGSVCIVRDVARHGLVEAALVVRSLVDEADIVVAHAHPFDVVPALALARPSGPPSIVLNHADHVFWVGASAFDVTACGRDSGAALSRERRGLSAARLGFISTPLDTPAIGRPREDAKAELISELGLEAGSALILTIAQPYKYEPAGGVDLLAAIAPVLASRRNLALVAVGPDNTGAWAEAARRTGGRVRALGRRRGITRYYEAADLYLDSAPFTSLTSLLEAGMYGVPLVSYQPHAEARVICADNPSLPGVHIVARTAATLTQEICALLDDPQLREALGNRTRDSIVQTHSPTAWRSHLEDLYKLAIERSHSRDDSLPEGEDAPLCELVDALLYELQRLSGGHSELWRILKRTAPHMPLMPRLVLRTKVRLRRLARFGRKERSLVTALDRMLFLN